jgi:hypothetical protein
MTMACEEADQRREREVAEMLVINGVELDLLHEVYEVRHLDDGDPVGFEKSRDAIHEAVEVRNVGEDVVRVDDIGALTFSDEPEGEIDAEELHQRGNPPLSHCHRGDVLRWLDPEYGNPGAHVVLQEIAVVAGNLDHETPGTQPTLGCHPSRQRFRRAQHRV